MLHWTVGIEVRIEERRMPLLLMIKIYVQHIWHILPHASNLPLFVGKREASKRASESRSAPADYIQKVVAQKQNRQQAS